MLQRARPFRTHSRSFAHKAAGQRHHLLTSYNNLHYRVTGHAMLLERSAIAGTCTRP
jgi:hypothetical protein